jgi:predicted HAD superfamily phosphohydrolase YqeG
MEQALIFGYNTCANRRVSEGEAVMFDIDETLIKVDGSQIPEMISLLSLCKTMNYTTVIMTARPPEEENIANTRQQLLENGIFSDKLVFASAPEKTRAKKMLGYKFVLSVGDQWTDLGGSEHIIKLPDMRDKNIYTQ